MVDEEKAKLLPCWAAPGTLELALGGELTVNGCSLGGSPVVVEAVVVITELVLDGVVEACVWLVRWLPPLDVLAPPWVSLAGGCCTASSMYGVSSTPPSASIAASSGTLAGWPPFAAAVALKFFATTVAFLLSS